MAIKTANLYARIEPAVKKRAEEILAELGISTSNAINMFYEQIILHQGIPFDTTLPLRKVCDMNKMGAAELDEALEQGYADMLAGRTRPAEDVFAAIRTDYGV